MTREWYTAIHDLRIGCQVSQPIWRAWTSRIKHEYDVLKSINYVDVIWPLTNLTSFFNFKNVITVPFFAASYLAVKHDLAPFISSHNDTAASSTAPTLSSLTQVLQDYTVLSILKHEIKD